MAVHIEIVKSNGMIRLSGELNYKNVTEVHKETMALFENENNICVDLGGITQADSAGVALLVEWLDDARHHNQGIHFVNIPKQMLEMVKVSHLDTVLPIS